MSKRVFAVALLSALSSSCGGSPPPAAVNAPSPQAAAPAPSASAAEVIVPPPREDGRLPDHAAPVSYQVDLDVDPSQKAYSGVVRVALRVPRPTQVVVLHARKLRVKTATLTAAGRDHTAAVASRLAYGSKGDADELVLTVAEPISGDASLRIVFDGDFAEGLNGLYRVDEGGKSYAFTQFEPFGARLAFPCFDEPSAKVPFELSVTVPAGLTALSNMPVARETAGVAGGKTTIAFEKSPPLPTYLVALAVGPLELRAGQTAPVPVRLAGVPGRIAASQVALDAAKDHLRVLEEYFGTRYPYPKLDLVAVPNFAAGAMENAGLVTFREERLLVDEKSPAAMRRSAYNVIAHELAHMWFGDLVTMKWWDDIWLNEGFATWMASKVLDTWRPDIGARVDALGGTAYALHNDTLDSARKVRQQVRSTTEALEAFDGITYQKGAALLEMVERWLGNDVFRSGIQKYLADHRFGNAQSEDLFASLSAASGKPVSPVLKSFTEQTGVPKVSFGDCKVENGAATVAVRQAEYRPLGATAVTSAKQWTFPTCVHFAGQKGADQACTLLEGAEKTLTIPGGKCPPWLHPNAEQSGYYRASLAPKALTALASLPRGTLTVRERVGVLSDAWAQVGTGELDVEAYVALAMRFRGDPEPEVWDQIVNALDVIDGELVTAEQRPAFTAAMRRLYAPEVAALGWDPRPKDGDAEKIRRRLVLIGLGATGRDAPTIARARKVADAWLTDPKSLDGDRASVSMKLAAQNGDAALYDRVVKGLSGATPDERVILVSALGEFRDPALVKRSIELLMDGTIRTQDQGYVLNRMFARSEVRAAALPIVAERIDTFIGRIPPFARRRVVPILSRSCGKEESERARALVAPRLASVEGADRGFAQALEEAARCGALREHHAPGLARWLAKPAPK